MIAWRLVPEPETRTAIGKPLLKSSCREPNCGLARGRLFDDCKLLQGVLAVRPVGALERVLAGEARVAMGVPARADRLVHALQRQVCEGVRADDLGDLLDGAPVGDHLLAGGHVDAVVAWVADRRRGHPKM